MPYIYGFANIYHNVQDRKLHICFCMFFFIYNLIDFELKITFTITKGILNHESIQTNIKMAFKFYNI